MPEKPLNKPFEFLLYKTNRLHFSVCVCVYCNKSQKTLQRVKNNSHATRLCLVSIGGGTGGAGGAIAPPNFVKVEKRGGWAPPAFGAEGEGDYNVL